MDPIDAEEDGERRDCEEAIEERVEPRLYMMDAFLYSFVMKS